MDPDVSGSIMDFEMEHHGGGGAVANNEIRMRDADLNVHYASPVTEVLTIPRGLAPVGIRPLPILKEAAHLEGLYGSPYVAKVPSPWTPYLNGTAEANSENHAPPFLNPSGEASRRRQEFLARQHSPLDSHTYRTQRLPYEWEVSAGADPHTPITMPMSLSTQIRLAEAESQRLRREDEQAQVGITLPTSSNASLRSSMKRPSPAVEEEEVEQTRDGASDQEPPRRITGSVANLFSYVPRLLSVVSAYFWPPHQEIVAVETNRTGRKRRAVADENMSSASVLSSPNPLHMPGHWPESTPRNLALMRCSVKDLVGAGTTDVTPTSRLDSADDARARATTITPSQVLVTSSLTSDPHAHDHASASETLNANIDPASITGTVGKNLKNQSYDQIAATVHAQNYKNDASDRRSNQTQDDASSSHATLSLMDVHQKDTEQLAKERRSSVQDEDRMAQERAGLTLRNSQYQPKPQYGTLARHLAAKRLALLPEGVRRDSAHAKPNATRDAEINALVDKARKVTIDSVEHKNFAKVRADEGRKARDAAAKEKAVKDAKKAADLAKKVKEKAKQKAERAERERCRKAEEREKKAEEETLERELDALVSGDVDKGKLVRPLDPKWVHKLQVAMSTKNEDEVLATSVAGVPLTRRDLAKLLPSAAWTAGSLPPGGGAPWLNDESVNAWLATIVTSKLEQAGWKRGDGAPPYVAFNSAWYTNYQKKGIAGIANWARRQKISGVSMFNTHRIFFPVNTGSHWILLIIQPREKKLEVLDSMHGRPTHFFRVLREWLDMELGDHYQPDEWDESNVKSGAQLNSDDCGVFVCVNALASAKDKPFSDIESTDGMFDARRMIGAILLNGGFHNDWQL